VVSDENPVISPVSVYLTLAAAGCGADGTTKDEFYRVLGKNMETLANSYFL
jgi:serine protease inhibitor